jgi:hypothetical protein
MFKANICVYALMVLIKAKLNDEVYSKFLSWNFKAIF